MRDPGSFVTRHTRIFETVVWGIAFFVTTGTFAGLTMSMLHSGPIEAADNAPPAAIMIEIADTAQAVLTEANDITPDRETSEESVAQAAQKQELKPDDKPLEPDKPESLAEESVEPKTAPVEKVEVPLPMAQPKKEKPQPRNKQAAKQSKAATQAQAHVQQADRTAAMQTNSGVSSISPANWQSRLMAHLESRKRYPSVARSRGERGTVYVRFTIDGAGNVLSASLARSSGHSELDQEVLSLVKRASPLPPPPPGANRTITAPVRFSA